MIIWRIFSIVQHSVPEEIKLNTQSKSIEKIRNSFFLHSFLSLFCLFFSLFCNLFFFPKPNKVFFPKLNHKYISGWYRGSDFSYAVGRFWVDFGGNGRSDKLGRFLKFNAQNIRCHRGNGLLKQWFASFWFHFIESTRDS